MRHFFPQSRRRTSIFENILRPSYTCNITIICLISPPFRGRILKFICALHFVPGPGRQEQRPRKASAINYFEFTPSLARIYSTTRPVVRPGSQAEVKLEAIRSNRSLRSFSAMRESARLMREGKFIRKGRERFDLSYVMVSIY